MGGQRSGLCAPPKGREGWREAGLLSPHGESPTPTGPHREDPPGLRLLPAQGLGGSSLCAHPWRCGGRWPWACQADVTVNFKVRTIQGQRGTEPREATAWAGTLGPPQPSRWHQQPSRGARNVAATPDTGTGGVQSPELLAP